MIAKICGQGEVPEHDEVILEAKVQTCFFCLLGAGASPAWGCDGGLATPASGGMGRGIGPRFELAMGCLQDSKLKAGTGDDRQTSLSIAFGG